MEDKISTQFLANTFTYTDALRRSSLLKQYLINRLFTISTIPLEMYEKDAAWITGLTPEFHSFFNQQNVYKLLEGLEQKIKQMEYVTLYVAFEIPYHEVIRIGRFLRENYGPNFLMELKLDPNIIGGCTLVKNGVYKDFSVRQKIQDNKAKILEVFKERLNL